MWLWCSPSWWHSVTAASLEQDWRCSDIQVAFLLLRLLEIKQGSWMAMNFVWDQQVSGRGSARSADAPVQRKLDDAALCFPLGLNKIRKSGLDSVLSLLSSGSTCFLTLAPFFLSRGSHLHMGLADNDILFISMFWTYHSASSGCPGPLQNKSLHIQPSPDHTITWPHHHPTVLPSWDFFRGTKLFEGGLYKTN